MSMGIECPAPLPKTAVCISGRLTSPENHANIYKHIIEPYKADVFIDTWIPYAKNSMKVGPKANMSADELSSHTIFPEDEIADINFFCELYTPKLINLEFFDGMPLTFQIRGVLPKNKKTYRGVDSGGTKSENVMFMWYKIWKCNQLRKFYEQINRIRYDRVIRLRMDNTFESFPVILPEPKTLYIPHHGDYMGGLSDQCAVGDSQTMDLYCDMYTDIYRYSVADIGIHPESMLRKHVEINRLGLQRFQCGMKLRGKEIG